MPIASAGSRSIANAARPRSTTVLGAAARVFRVGLGLIGLLTVTAVAHAQSGWVLWERPLDLKGQPQGAWHRREVFEAERWCKGAMTIAINKAMTPKKRDDSENKESIVEYQCRPEGAAPPGAKTPR